MARFDVYANLGSRAATTPYLVDVQSTLFDGLESRVVVPLRRIGDFPEVKLPERLTPILHVLGTQLLLQTPQLGAVPLRVLKAPVASLADRQAEITAAMDFLFQGY